MELMDVTKKYEQLMFDSTRMEPNITRNGNPKGEK